MDVEPHGSDPVVAMSPMKVCSCSQLSGVIRADDSQSQTGGIIKASPVRIRELAGSEELRPLETNPEDGRSSEGSGIRGFTPPQSIMNRFPVGISTPRERLEIGTGMKVTMQSTPATLPRGQQQAGQMFRKPKVTFATGQLKEKEGVRTVQNETTPRSGAQRRSIFEEDMFGTSSAWKRPYAKSSEKHANLIEVWSCLTLIQCNRGRSRP